jgi:hypothetical protein
MGRSDTREDSPQRFAIIGAGMSGILAAAKLREEGHNCTVFERPSASKTYIVPTSEAASSFEDERVEAAKGTVWATGCRSWYLDDRGIPFVWPFPFSRFVAEMEKPRFSDYTTG